MTITRLEAVTTARQAAVQLCADLQAVNSGADPVAHLLLLPMLKDAVKLRDQLTALQDALRQSLPETNQTIYTLSSDELSCLAAGISDAAAQGFTFAGLEGKDLRMEKRLPAALATINITQTL